MAFYDRPFDYESPDFDAMCALIIRDNAVRRENFVWHIARLVDWKYNRFNPRRRFPENYASAAHLWTDDNGVLAGFAVSEEIDGQFEIIVLDEYKSLYPEMLAWAGSGWGGKYPQLITSAVETNLPLIAALERAGYEKNGDMDVTRMFDTSRFRDFPFPEAPLCFQSMAQNKNYANQRRLRLSAWPNALEAEADEAIRAYCRTSPIYDARFDFVLVDESGAHLAGCEAFIDRTNGTAEIERVCTQAAHRHKGYARLTIESCLRVLHESQIPAGYLTGGNEETIRLYGSMGHVKEVARHYYSMNLHG
jgi:GNAT superfamily N-acetyltransferase